MHHGLAINYKRTGSAVDEGSMPSHDAATPRSPQYFSTSFLSDSRWWLTVSMISLTPLIVLQYSNVSAICMSTAVSWLGSHYYASVRARTVEPRKHLQSRSGCHLLQSGAKCA